MTRIKRNTPPDLTFPRVFRGGCWGNSDPAWVRAANRHASAPANRFVSLGFRCALRGRKPR